ncbi:MAG: AbrB/MazE/SpoVT family DNA-binding domain-containing protein [Anaerolineaceae bacterium]|nr:AbrB/MazE/SpoVT family DNA-binding domain-containing protein [Anaerolineaceae bacterium]MBN2676452.1 AbrB/MazE/SpoVT family DNA-binding domain-containing protein [Anaerolineaceae bacterium]
MKAPPGKYMWSVKVGEKGQIVLPKEARQVFDIKPGDKLLLLGDAKRGMAIINSHGFKLFTDAAFSLLNKKEGQDE